MSGAVNATANLAQGIHAQPDNLALWVVARKGFARLSIGLAAAKLGCPTALLQMSDFALEATHSSLLIRTRPGLMKRAGRRCPI